MKISSKINLPERENVSKDMNSISWQAWSVLIVIVSILIILFFTSIVLKRTVNSDKLTAIAHVKQVQLAFYDFELEYGARPGQWIVDEGMVPSARAVTANECFRQCLQALDSVRSEAIFYTPSRISLEPDHVIGDESNHFAEACGKGEVGFLYVDAPNSKIGAPLMAAPLYDVKGRFDNEIYGGEAIILKTDGSVITRDIDPDTGRIYIDTDGERINMFSDENPLFRGKPSIKYPEPK